MWKAILIGLVAPPGAAFAGPAPSGYFPLPADQPSIRCGWPLPTNHSRQVAVDSFDDEWFSKHLKAAGEPSLYRAARRPHAAGAGALRFTWLPSFHHPVIVRIVWGPGQPPRLIATLLSGAGGYEPGHIDKRMNRPLTKAEMTRLRALLLRTRVLEEPPTTCTFGVDGAEWVIESVSGAGYHLIKRWSPEKGGVHELGMALLGLTGWRFREVY